jgi:trigger factor
MQVTETLASGLKRELSISVGQGELGERFTSRLDEVKGQLHLKGFRKGKVPVAHVKKLYGRSVMAEVLQQTVEETSRRAIAERKERPAHQPAIKLSEDKDEIERVLAGQSDLTFTMSFEVLPLIEEPDLGAVRLEREVADVSPEVVDKAIAELLERSIRYEPEPGRAASDGDRMTIDYMGSLEGTPFEGGKGEDVQLVVGQSSFIPGFLEGIVGAVADERRQITATFPAEYPEPSLAGKDATFDVTVKEVAKPIKPELDDAFAKTLGAESLNQLKERVSARIAAEYGAASRQKLKRRLLDALDKAYSGLPLPQSLVDAEYQSMWGQLTEQLKAAGKTLAEEGKNEDDTKAEYRGIAERRVRLGLIIGDIGDKNQVQVTQEELRRALIEQARRYPGQERLVYAYYEKNPQHLMELRAPIFEDKVVDLVLAKVATTEKKVPAVELLRPDEEPVAPSRTFLEANTLQHAGHEHGDEHHGDHHHHHDDPHHHHDHPPAPGDVAATSPATHAEGGTPETKP